MSTSDSFLSKNIKNGNKRDVESQIPCKRRKVEDLSSNCPRDDATVQNCDPIVSKSPLPYDETNNANVVARHYNRHVETVQRNQSRIFYMRNFNNWIKTQLINEYLINDSQRDRNSVIVLDLCCGKGGDLMKWEKANANHIICTDIAQVSIEQCKERYKNILSRIKKMGRNKQKFTAEFFTCDATLVRIRERFQDPSIKLNLVSCQFAFHYCFESITQANCMIRNAAECLKPGGFFIASIPDDNEIMRRLNNSENKRTFGNELYKIEFVGDIKPPPLFGAKYKFKLDGVVDCPEFLVHFPTMVKLCHRHGLKLVRKTTFADYFQENIKKESARRLIDRMNGLETVYPNRIMSDREFAHVKEARRGYMSQPVDTLSKSEWEVVSLYLVCAFRKCKYTWDANGKPVFQYDD